MSPDLTRCGIWSKEVWKSNFRNMDRWKAEMGRVREEKRREEKKRRKKRREEKRRRKKKEDQKRESLRRKKIQAARKSRKVAKHCVFPMICGSGGSKSRLAKAAGAEPAGQMRDENCMPLWREAHFQVKMYKTPPLRSTFRSCNVEKVHAVLARSTFAK